MFSGALSSIKETFEEEADKLEERLEDRQYRKEVVQAARQRASLIPRLKALEKVVRQERTEGRQHRLVC